VYDFRNAFEKAPAERADPLGMDFCNNDRAAGVRLDIRFIASDFGVGVFVLARRLRSFSSATLAARSRVLSSGIANAEATSLPSTIGVLETVPHVVMGDASSERPGWIKGVMATSVSKSRF
jgi:hypothetical protein